MVELKVHSQLPKEVKLLMNDHMMTPTAAIQKLQTQIDWFTKMAVVEKALTLPDNLPEGKERFQRFLWSSSCLELSIYRIFISSLTVDLSKLRMLQSQQNDTLAEMTDETAAVCANIYRILHNVERFKQFINENPLSKWIPKKETFNGKTYQEYEREFMMYYNMIQK